MDDDDPSLFEKIFSIGIVREKILKEVFQKKENRLCIRHHAFYKNFLEYRLISKSVNQSILNQVRQMHNHVNIVPITVCWGDDDGDDDEDDEEDETLPVYIRPPEFLINECNIKLSKLSKYFEFLVEVAQVKVEKMKYEKFEYHSEEQIDMGHSCIVYLLKNNLIHLKKFYGMHELCDGCEDCIDFSNHCQEHDFLTVEKFRRGYEVDTHFKQLTFHYKHISQLADFCTNASNTKEQSMNELLSLTKNMSCNTLELQGFLNGFIYPLEVVSTALKAWKVKSVVLTMQDYPPNSFEKFWDKKPFFTPFSYKTSPPVDFSFDSRLDDVTINMTKDSCFDLCSPDADLIVGIKSLLKVFPTGKMVVLCSFAVSNYHPEDCMDKFTQNVANLIKKNNLNQMELTISYPEDSFVNASMLPDILKGTNHLGNWRLVKSTVLRTGKHSEEAPGKHWNSKVLTIRYSRKLFILENRATKSLMKMEISIETSRDVICVCCSSN